MRDAGNVRTARRVGSRASRPLRGMCGSWQGDCQVLTGPGRLKPALGHTGAVIRLGIPADLPAAAGVYRRASLSNAGDRDNLLAHPEYLILGPEGLAEGRTYVAEKDGSVVGFATWADAGGAVELEDLFVDPGWRRRGIATALVSRIVDVLRARGVQALEVTANPHAQGFYSAAGFIDCGVAETDFGPAPRKRRAIH
jgi:GNAT superfamily N-acetyltransferase